MTEAIKVENLSKVFYNKKAKDGEAEIWALKNASFEVNKGEIFGLLGPNGAGKTTAIRCIAGLLKPASGAVYVNGESMNQFQAHLLRKDMGFLTENHGNYEQLSLYDNLEFFGSFYEIDNLDRRIDSVLDEMGLLKRREMKAGKLSKGQKQRLAIARAILHNPQILFFDEPTSGLDPVASVKVRNLILKLKDDNRTIFINSHNLEEVQKICDRVAILDLGQIKRIGTPASLSKELWDTQEMVCTLKNSVSPQIENHLTIIDYIKDFRIEGNNIFFYSNDATETTPRIIKDLVNNGAEILEVKMKEHSLEDIYLELMQPNQNDEEVR